MVETPDSGEEQEEVNLNTTQSDRVFDLVPYRPDDDERDSIQTGLDSPEDNQQVQTEDQSTTDITATKQSEVIDTTTKTRSL